MIRIETLTAESGLGERLEDIATLRIAVFRDWPYLYDGDHGNRIAERIRTEVLPFFGRHLDK